jgi:hypothetical protein
VIRSLLLTLLDWPIRQVSLVAQGIHSEFPLCCVLQFATVDNWFDWRAEQPHVGYVTCWYCSTRPHRWVEGHGCDDVCYEYYRPASIADRMGLLQHLPSEVRDDMLTPLHVIETQLLEAIRAGETNLRVVEDAQVSP